MSTERSAESLIKFSKFIRLWFFAILGEIKTNTLSIFMGRVPNEVIYYFRFSAQYERKVINLSSLGGGLPQLAPFPQEPPGFWDCLIFCPYQQ